MSESTGYNGWSNYETWLVSLWLNNEPGKYTALQEICSKPVSDYEQVEMLEEWAENGMVASEMTGMAHDLVHAALVRVNWFGIVESNRP